MKGNSIFFLTETVNTRHKKKALKGWQSFKGETFPRCPYHHENVVSCKFCKVCTRRSQAKKCTVGIT